MKTYSLRQIRIWQAIGSVVVLLLVGGVIASTSTVHHKRVEINVAEMPMMVDETPSTGAVHEETSASTDVRTQAEPEGARQEGETVEPVRKRLTQDEMFLQDWPVDRGANLAMLKPETYRFEALEVIYEPGKPALITIRNSEPPKEVVAQVTTDRFVPYRREGEVLKMDRQEGMARVQPFVDEFMGKLYMFITFGNSHVGWLGKVYESDIFGVNVRELGKETVWYTSGVQDFRFSPDRTTLSYVADETDARLNDITGVVEQIGGDRIVFHIIDLLDTKESIQFVLPYGDKALGYGKEKLWVRAWQFLENKSVEIMLYRRESAEEQEGVNELWRYDRETGESTLIESRAVTGAS
nr:hypothetical protein [Thiocapsa sp. KS1]